MPKTYKHKTLGWIAKPAQDDDVRIKESLQGKYDIFKGHHYCNVNNHRMSEKELIELGFEEVIEKDWVSDFYDFLVENEQLWQRDSGFIKAIEKYVPKQKKFTLSEISDFYHNLGSMVMGTTPECSNVYIFLKQHNLLSFEEPLQN